MFYINIMVHNILKMKKVLQLKPTHIQITFKFEMLQNSSFRQTESENLITCIRSASGETIIRL